MMKSFSCSPLIFLVLRETVIVTPAEADVGVVAFGLGKFTDFLKKSECFPEIAKSKGPHNFETVDRATSMPSLSSSPWMPNQLNASNDERGL